MTVWTASLFVWFYGEDDNGAAIIAACDRMLADGGLGIEYNASRWKCAPLTKHVILLVSGDFALNSILIDRLISFVAENPETQPETFARALGGYIAELRAERASRKYLEPLGLTYESIIGTPGGLKSFGLPEPLLNELANQMQAERLDSEFIVAGCKERAAWLYHVDGWGLVSNHTNTGFLSIGSGGIHSSAYYMQMPYNHIVGYHEALFSTFIAKKACGSSSWGWRGD